MNVLIFSDELEVFQKHLNSIQTQMQEQQKRLGEAHQQDPNGRHDNFDFEDARREISRLNDMYGKQRKIIDHARILTLNTLTAQKTVSLGSNIIILIDNQEFTFTIGGYDSKIPGRLAYNSPLGQQIMKRNVGDSCEVRLGQETKKVVIKEIR